MAERTVYNKPALTYEEQLQRLKRRGLQVHNDGKALHLLRYISYYRLSGYWYPLLKENKSNHLFKSDATFEKAYRLYLFDKELRKLISTEIEKVEVAVRSKLANEMAHLNNPFWLMDSTLFVNRFPYRQTIAKISEEVHRSDVRFLQSFRAKYSNDLPPCWITLEVVSLGTLSRLYSGLKTSAGKRTVANIFGLNDSVFGSWLHTLVYVRNICAHHGRLWNRELRIRFRYPDSIDGIWLENLNVHNGRVYMIFSVLIFLLNVINPGHSFISRIKLLLSDFPEIDLKAMGFPDHWDKELLWKGQR